MKEKGIALSNALQKPSDSSMEGLSAVSPAEYVMKTVLTGRYLKTATEDMSWTGPNVTAAECACTTVLSTTLPLKTELSMAYVHAAESVKRHVRTVWMVMSLKKTSNLI